MDPLDIIDAEAILEEEEEEAEGESVQQQPPEQWPLEPRLTWEERALAVERVPPANVPAWGPTGDLGVDARAKALQDALEDIQMAQQRVEERRQQVAALKDDMAVLRVDAELERQRLLRLQQQQQRPPDSRRSATTNRSAREQMRRTERQIQDTARRLRLRQLQRDAAVEDLAAIEARHWALLKAFDPVKTEQVLKDAFAELEQTEPAVRRHSAKLKTQMAEAEAQPEGSSASTSSPPPAAAAPANELGSSTTTTTTNNNNNNE